MHLAHIQVHGLISKSYPGHLYDGRSRAAGSVGLGREHAEQAACWRSVVLAGSSQEAIILRAARTAQAMVVKTSGWLLNSITHSPGLGASR